LGGIEGTEYEITIDNVEDVPLFEQSDGEIGTRFNDHFRIAVLGPPGSQLLVMYGADIPPNFAAFDPLAKEVLATVEFEE
jgi:hypothetical protein